MLEWVAIPSAGDLPHPWIEQTSPAKQHAPKASLKVEIKHQLKQR